MPSEKPESRVLPHALDVEHCLSQIASIPKHIIHKTAPQQCSTSRATPTSECGALPPPPVPPLQPNKPQQASITEYFKSQMKPTNGLNREVAAWFSNKALPETKKGAEGFNKYIAYLSQTLCSKGLLDSPKDMAEEPMDVDTQKTEPEKMPLPRLNTVVKNNNNMSSVVKKTDFHKTNCTPQNKASKEVRVRGPTKQIKKYRIAEAKKAVIPKLNTNKTQQAKDKQSTGAAATNLNCVYPNVVNKAQTLVDGNVLVNSNTLPMAQVSTLPDHLRQLLVKVKAAHSRTLNPQDTKSSNRVNGETNLEQVPSVNHHSAQMHNSDIKPLHRTESFMSTPPVSVASSNSNISVPMSPAVMLATVRMPEHNVPGSHPETQPTTSTNHISITNQNGMNSSFMLPLVQNLNGTLLQIPGLVTKVGQNQVMPIGNPNILTTTTSNGLTHPQSQMFINGAFLKINGHIQTNLSGLNKPIGSNNIPNVSYAVTPKNLPSSMPTMIGSKPNFTMNLNHPMFVSSSGFIFNSLGNVVTTQTNTGLTHMQPPFTSNVVLTTPVHPGVHITPHMNNTLSSLPLSTGSIPLSSIKLDGINPVFITSQTQQPTYSIPEMKEENMIISNTPSIVPNSLELCSNPTNEISNIPDSGVVDNMDTSNINNSSENITISQSSETCNGTIEEKETCIFSEEKNCQTEPNEDDIEMKTDNAFIVSEETKSSIDSVSLDNNRNNDSPSADSPGTEISKEIDEDSLNISVMTNQEFSISQTSSILSEPKTIRFPAKKLQCNETRSRTVRSSSSETKHCQWNDCSRHFEDGSDLLEHLQVCFQIRYLNLLNAFQYIKFYYHNFRNAM